MEFKENGRDYVALMTEMYRLVGELKARIVALELEIAILKESSAI